MLLVEQSNVPRAADVASARRDSPSTLAVVRLDWACYGTLCACAGAAARHSLRVNGLQGVFLTNLSATWGRWVVRRGILKAWEEGRTTCQLVDGGRFFSLRCACGGVASGMRAERARVAAWATPPFAPVAWRVKVGGVTWRRIVAGGRWRRGGRDIGSGVVQYRSSLRIDSCKMALRWRANIANAAATRGASTICLRVRRHS